MNSAKRQKLPSGLWVVATPIGNLEDLTPRARGALESADVILCEDTRRTAELLSALGMARPHGGLERLDEHATKASLSAALARLEGGENLALVTDAGTPGVSDPGAALVAAAQEAGIRVTPIPGATAVAALLSASGIRGTEFVFRGFFPRKDSERDQEIELAVRSPAARTWIWFESPQRIGEALEHISQNKLVLDSASKVSVIAGKELTKIHERIFSGAPSEVAAQVGEEIAGEGARGEWSFIVHFDFEAAAESSDWVKGLQCLLDARVAASEAAKRVSQHFGAPRKIVYETALKISGKKS